MAEWYISSGWLTPHLSRIVYSQGRARKSKANKSELAPPGAKNEFLWTDYSQELYSSSFLISGDNDPDGQYWDK